jgi:hypothetical protein
LFNNLSICYYHEPFVNHHCRQRVWQACRRRF